MMSTIVILLVSTFLLPTANCNTCASVPNGVHLFGPKCGFMCHCKNNEKCDVISGECSSGCASMWYGPGCQYRDMAEGELSRHSDNMEPHYWSPLANDGNVRTCSYTAEVNSTEKKTNPFWRVWLPTQETIRELMIVTKVEALENFTNFSVYVENVSEYEKTNKDFVPSDRQECYKHDNVAPKNETMMVLCKTPLAGNQIRIELAALQAQLIICDVRINGGRNIAFGRVTSQSSRHRACYQSNDMCTSEKAVDGYNQQSYWHQCSFTNNELNPWWQLDIGHLAQIWYAQIFSTDNITDSSTLQLNVSNSTNGLWETVSDQLQQNIPSLNNIARFVKLTMLGHYRRLTLCEVKIFGDCLEGTCGYDCSKECHCKETNVWDKISGICSYGCRDRWTGTHCNLSCDGKHWGPQCQNKCGHCLKSAPCDVSTGECPNGCQEGYNPPECNSSKQQLSVCGNGKYGLRCSQTCPVNCKEGSVCNKVNGQCDSGCRPGFIGDKCDKMCNNGKYGLRCSQTCPVNCKENTVCNKVNGQCDLGCRPGFIGDRCDKMCDNGKYGLRCSQTCPVNCRENTVCNKVNGQCDSGCRPGFIGDRCDKICREGRYGLNCQKICSTNCVNGKGCNKVNGQCEEGCKAGYRGQHCDQAVDQKEKVAVLPVSVGGLTGSLVVAVLLLTISVIVACVYRRKYMSAFRNAGRQSIADTTISYINVQKPAEDITTEVMVSTYETIRESIENEHEYELSQQQSS